MSHEKRLYQAVIYRYVKDAIGIFYIPQNTKTSRKSIEKQYQDYRKKFKGKKFHSRVQMMQKYRRNKSTTHLSDVYAARNWLCSSHFDAFVAAIDQGGVFLNKIFAFVQEAITYEKKLFEEFFCPAYLRRHKTRQAKRSWERLTPDEKQKELRKILVERLKQAQNVQGIREAIEKVNRKSHKIAQNRRHRFKP